MLFRSFHVSILDGDDGPGAVDLGDAARRLRGPRLCPLSGIAKEQRRRGLKRPTSKQWLIQGYERESRQCSLPLTSMPCPSLELPGNRHGLPSEDYSGPGNIKMKTYAC